MLQAEFETLTEIYPDRILYECIEHEYYRKTEDGKDFWPDKHSFCHAYKFNEDGIARHIQSAANEAIWRREEAHRRMMQESAVHIEALYKELHDREAYCKMLEEKLEAEQEWTPAKHTGTNLDQSVYEDYLASAASEVLSDYLAKEKLSAFFGFDTDRIEIVREVSTYERNRHGKLRVVDTFRRDPIYGASDWNYIRFDCAGNQWEMIDGELVPYED